MKIRVIALLNDGTTKTLHDNLPLTGYTKNMIRIALETPELWRLCFEVVG